MAILALVVAVVLFAALAVVFAYSQRRVNRILAGILATPVSYSYAAPPSESIFSAVSTNAPDVTGAWAEEQSRLGCPVSDEEIEEQRAMWAREG